MSGETRISIFEVVGNPLCVASSDGQKVYDRLSTALEEERHVALSFHNVTTLTSAFLNAAIGQLYGEFSEEQVRALLTIEDAEQDDLALLKRVVDNAKLYFRDPKRFDKIVERTQENAEDEMQSGSSEATQLYLQVVERT